ncbi:hypothetical protein BX667DRAFT_314114 [Coemansia mojavensis]|nr:hypothetical protein BX667DRAFT_314114 [Coemansia mojavensis]
MHVVILVHTVEATKSASISTVTLVVFGFILGAAFFGMLISIAYCAYHCCFPLYYNRQQQQRRANTTLQYAVVNRAVNDVVARKLQAENQAIQLPQHIFDLKSSVNDAFETSRICMICLSSDSTGDALAALLCKHSCHYECAARWLNTNSKCPLCNHLVIK